MQLLRRKAEPTLKLTKISSPGYPIRHHEKASALLLPADVFELSSILKKHCGR
jgi:hypothetical protein